MKLLLDENLSPKVINRLNDRFSGSLHVEEIGLGNETDYSIWKYALKNDFIIVTKDTDFNDLSIIHGFPPYLIWIKRGNCSTEDIFNLIQQNVDLIQAFYEKGDHGIMTLL